METCRWIYRPGTLGSHWAKPTCRKNGKYNYLSRITNKDPVPGCADYYDNKKCPICGKTIKMDYSTIEK